MKLADRYLRDGRIRALEKVHHFRIHFFKLMPEAQIEVLIAPPAVDVEVV